MSETNFSGFRTVEKIGLTLQAFTYFRTFEVARRVYLFKGGAQSRSSSVLQGLGVARVAGGLGEGWGSGKGDF